MLPTWGGAWTHHLCGYKKCYLIKALMALVVALWDGCESAIRRSRLRIYYHYHVITITILMTIIITIQRMAGTSQVRVPTSTPGWVLWTNSRFELMPATQTQSETSALFSDSDSDSDSDLCGCEGIVEDFYRIDKLHSNQMQSRDTTAQFCTEFAQHSYNRFRLPTSKYTMATVPIPAPLPLAPWITIGTSAMEARH